jgi:uncharacterized protein (TIGR01244 family)
VDLRRVTEAFSVSPQIALADLTAIADLGFAMVISNRPDGEDPGQPTAAEVDAAAREAGLDFRHIPVAGGFPEPSIREMALALDGATGPVFAFCRSGTRSTLLWALAQASRGGAPDAIAEAAAQAGYDLAPVRAAVEQLASAAHK